MHIPLLRNVSVPITFQNTEFLNFLKNKETENKKILSEIEEAKGMGFKQL